MPANKSHPSNGLVTEQQQYKDDHISCPLLSGPTDFKCGVTWSSAARKFDAIRSLKRAEIHKHISSANTVMSTSVVDLTGDRSMLAKGFFVCLTSDDSHGVLQREAG